MSNFYNIKKSKKTSIAVRKDPGVKCVPHEGGGYMTMRKLLICDTDTAYVKALTTYLMQALQGFSITMYTDTEAFSNDEEDYRVSLLGDEFLKDIDAKKTAGDTSRFGRILHLCSASGGDDAGYPAVFKFQQMGTFVKAILSYSDMRGSAESEDPGRKQRWYGIHSPIRHELQLPFAIAYGRMRARQERVLFLDLETNSIMEDLIDCEKSRSLLDALYLAEEAAGADIAELADYYEGMFYLAPMRNFGEAVRVQPEQWERLFCSVRQADFDSVVVLFDDGVQCMSELFGCLEELILLCKPGDYYQKSKGKVLHYIESLPDRPVVQDVDLALSGGNLTDGTYRFEQLLEGNLGRFVESTFA